MQTGLPTSIILPFAEISLEPDQVNISEDGSVATNFKFKSPVFTPRWNFICNRSNLAFK